MGIFGGDEDAIKKMRQRAAKEKKKADAAAAKLKKKRDAAAIKAFRDARKAEEKAKARREQIRRDNAKKKK